MTKIRTTQDVLLFIPNLIGYARILAALTSFVVMVVFPEHWASAILLYIANFAGDLVDGIAARTFHQTSTFGSVLDMVTDRCSTLGLLYVLAGDFGHVDTALRVPAFRLLFLFLMLLDISSHWCQMYSSLAVGLHHKSDEGNADRHILVRWFYKYYWFFGYLCVGAEFTYIALYALVHMNGSTGIFDVAVKVFLAGCIPGCVAKQAVNVMQLASACYLIAKTDAENYGKSSKEQ
jgi:CDP-diacylglycerol--inositol 3-phosphatidyltransferase